MAFQSMDEVDLKRSANMSKIRSVNTRPEVTVRKGLHARGFRFRLHRKDLPGKPDLVLARYRVVIFVHGCFWHQHSGCRLASWPKSRGDYWGPKLKRNMERDALAEVRLTELGWRTLVVWECDTRSADRWVERLDRLVTEILADAPKA
jgi:DNA mismatch endonuclease (patch repair protein)